MAAYAAVVSLMNTIDNILNHPRLSNSLDESQITSLGTKLDFFLGFIESYNYHGGSEDREDLECQIASAAHAAEDIIEFHMVDLINGAGADAKRKARMISDGESALRSRIKKRDLLADLQTRISQLRLENSTLLNYLTDITQKTNEAAGDSVALKSHVEKLRAMVKMVEDTSKTVTGVPEIATVGTPLSSCLDTSAITVTSVQEDPVLIFGSAKENSNSLYVEDVIGAILGQVNPESIEEGFLWIPDPDDVNKSRFLDQITAPSIPDQCKRSSSFFLGLQEIMEEMDSIKENVTKVQKERTLKIQQKYPLPPTVSSRLLTTVGKTTVVGFGGYLNKLLDWLTGQQSDRQILAITGMAGIGKTTLARLVYEDPLILQHFDVLAWVTVSQKYNVMEILNETLSCLGESTSKLDGRAEDELGVQLHKTLSGRRYLIVLDDMWNIEAWNKIRFFFPENQEKSRILVTTRQLNVANYFGSLGIAINFLNDDESWSLFSGITFAEEGCPLELEKIGKKIVKKCRGLPLSIVVIGGLLRKSSLTQEYWENVARDVGSFMNSGVDKRCMDILSLGYCHLPACLKPCLLYMGIFPEDHEIRVSLLVKLWIAEGFLRPKKGQSLEEVAEGHINDLVDKNLVLVRTLKLNGKIKTCYIHDLLRDLCLRNAEREKFLYVTGSLVSQGDRDRRRRILVHGRTVKEELQDTISYTLESTSLTRSLICKKPAKLSLKCKLLRILITVPIGSLCDTTFGQVNFRFLAHEYENTPTDYIYKLPSSISRLWNVQTLIMTKGIPKVEAPPCIWEMRQLRHLKFNLISLPDPRPSHEGDNILVNLQTLETVSNFRCSKEMCQRIPNVKKLRILYENDSLSTPLGSHNYYSLHNVGSLHKLESLKCSFYHQSRDDLLQNLKFPSSLKKLTLENCGLRWSDLTAVGSLPHLEFLKLYNIVAGEPEWNPVDGEFLRLKFLGIYGCSQLIRWNADNSHFPVLQKLVLERLWKLEETPSGIGEIPTLQRICVYDCNISAAISAAVIQKEQEYLENHGLQVEIDFSMRKDLLKFRKRVGRETANMNLL